MDSLDDRLWTVWTRSLMDSSLDEELNGQFELKTMDRLVEKLCGQFR